MTAGGHGFIGSHLQPFTDLLPTRSATFDATQLSVLSEMMKSKFDTPKDGDDPEENLWVPAGYTYFGQFVDHDLTFDSTSSLNPADRPPQGSHVPSNLRTPRFDLDNVYGDGPDAQPFMYASDGATLLTNGDDLLRAPNGRAIIGDKRNDENSIVCQVHLGIVRYHNAVVSALGDEPPESWNVPHDLFSSARNEVLWTYQLLLVHDFLPRVIKSSVLQDLEGCGPEGRIGSYALYTRDKRANLPREFVGAAYRYGHSGVRTGYRLNRRTRLSIFPGTGPNEKPTDESLLGFDPLPPSHVIDDWERFFPASPPGADVDRMGRVAADEQERPEVRLQFAYKLDPNLVDPLGVLPLTVPEPGAAEQAAKAIAPSTLPDGERPSLALLNLLRGNSYGIATGQDVAEALITAGKPVECLTERDMVIRIVSDDVPAGGNPDKVQAFRWTAIPEALSKQTPLWFYVLAEAQAPLRRLIGDDDGLFLETDLLVGVGAATQLGWVGGRIVAEVFYGLLDDDPESIFNHPAAAGFRPRLVGGVEALLCVRNLLDFGRTT